MNSTGFLVSLVGFAFAAAGVNAEFKQLPVASPSDALFAPNRLLQIQIRMDPKDWHALRISHPDLDGDLVPIRMNYEYYPADAVIDGQLVKSVGVSKRSAMPWVNVSRPS